MLHFARWKTVTILAVCLLGTLVAMVNLAPRSAFPSWFPARQVSLGLDLRGGSYLLLEVDLNTVVRERLDGMIDGARTRLRAANIRYVNLAADPANRRMGLRVLDAAQAPGGGRGAARTRQSGRDCRPAIRCPTSRSPANPTARSGRR